MCSVPDTLLDIQPDTHHLCLRPMTTLHDLAGELRVSERTLRRAVADGTIRGSRPSVRRLTISQGEREWVLRYWPLIARVRAALRTEPSVRLAVLFGSSARGREHGRSDLDVLIELDGASPGRLAALEERLTAVAGQDVQLVWLGDAQGSASLMAEVLRDGRVLVDRAGLWPRLKRRERRVAEAARRQDQELLAEALQPLDGTKR